MVRSMLGMMAENFRKALPLFRPIREIMVCFCITGYLIYKLPITEEMKAKSKYLHPELIHEKHHK